MSSSTPTYSSLSEFRRIEPAGCFKQHIASGARADGRPTLLSPRPVSMSAGTISTADGSAVIRQGDTLVACGVTLQLARPTEERPDEGFVVPNVDLPPLCHPRFKPGPPPEQAQLVANFLSEVIANSQLVDKKKLCISPGKLAWVLNVDVVCLNYDGNIWDVAVKAMVGC